jgi:hypothetical protein
MKLLKFCSVKSGQLRVSRQLSPVGRRELDKDLLDGSDWREGERAEIRLIQLNILKWKLYVAAVNGYQDRRNELRFFADRASKKWPLRGSLKESGMLVAYLA